MAVGGTARVRRTQEARSARSRQRLLTAAAVEFASRGFAGGSVDRIARAARVNKAMIYYHFGSKAALYREILRDMFAAVSLRVGEAARGTAAPEDKIRAFVDAFATEAEARPHFPPIWFREIAEGGAHLDPRHARQHVPACSSRWGTSCARGPRRAVSANQSAAGACRDHRAASAVLRQRTASRPARARGRPGIATVSRDDVVAARAARRADRARRTKT